MLILKWILFLIVIVAAVKASVHFKDREFQLNLKKAPQWIVVVLVLLIILPAVGAIPAGTRGVVLRFGAVTGRILPEGIYFVTPIAERVELMSVQVVAYPESAASASKDLQDVTTQVTLNYYLEASTVAKVYQTLRRDYQERIIKPAIQEAVKAATAQFDAEKLITERPVVKEAIETSLKTRLKEHGIIVDTISITDFKFSPEFTRAIESKVTAVQEALQAQNELKKIEFQAQQKVTTAKAEAESLRMQKEQVTPQLIALRQIEVQRMAVEKWNGVLPTTVTGSGPVPILDVFKK